MTWAHTSGCFRAFEHDFGVRTTDAALGRFLSDLLDPLAEPGTPARWYEIEDRGPAVDDRYTLTFDRATELSTPSPALMLSTLLWHVNRKAVDSCTSEVLVHAAAAEHEGRAILLPARMEAGKTTLVAGLVRAGLRYLTDEAVAIAPESLQIRGLAKPLTIELGSWQVLADLKPTVPDEIRRYVGAQWHVDVRTIRADALAGVAEPCLVIVPRYERGATTKLTPLARPMTLMALCENSFNLSTLGRAGLDGLAAVVQRSACYELVVGDLDVACALVIDALGRPAPATVEAPRDIPDARSSILSVGIEADSVLYDTTTGALHHLDAMGTIIWASCDGSTSIDELAADLAHAFGDDRSRIRRDIETFVHDLLGRGLLTGDATRPSRPGAIE